MTVVRHGCSAEPRVARWPQDECTTPRSIQWQLIAQGQVLSGQKAGAYKTLIGPGEKAGWVLLPPKEGLPGDGGPQRQPGDPSKFYVHTHIWEGTGLRSWRGGYGIQERSK